MSRLRLPVLFLRGSFARLALAVLALAIAVAGVCAADLVDASVLRAVNAVIDGLATRAALHVVAADGGAFAEDVALEVAGMPGVERAVGIVDGTAITSDAAREVLTVMGVDLTDEQLGRRQGVQVTVERHLLAREPDAILLTAGFAARRGLRIGDRLAVETPAGERRLAICGLLEPGAVGRVLAETLVVMQLAAAEELFARPGLVNRVEVTPSAGHEPRLVAQAVARALPARLSIEEPIPPGLELASVKRSLVMMLGGAAAIGIVLSVLIASGRLATDFTARSWQMGVLRAVGVRRRAVWQELVSEGLLLGAIGVVVGIPLGIGLGRLLLPMLNASTAAGEAMRSLAAAELELRFASLLLATVVGLGSGLLAAGLAARRAAAVPAAVALRRRGIELTPGSSAVAWAVRGATLLGIGVALALQATTRAPAWGIAVTVLILALAILAARPAVHLLGAAVAAHLPVPVAPLAAANVLRNAGRSGLTVAMLAVGLGCLLWIATLSASLETTLAETLRARLGAELIVVSARAASGWLPAPLDDRVLARLADVPGVVAVAGNRVVKLELGAGSVAINALDAAYFTGNGFGRPVLVGEPRPDVWEAVARGEGVLVSTGFAERFAKRVGDPVILESPFGTLVRPVVGISVSFMSPQGTVEMSRELFARYWNDRRVNRVWVRTDRDPSAIEAAIASGPARALGLRVVRSSEMLGALVAEVRRAFAPLAVARTVLLVVVLLGMADTLAAGVVQRVREFGIVRAVGVRRRRVRGLVYTEGLLMAVPGLVLAAAVALALGGLWVWTTFPYLLGWRPDLHLPYAEFATLSLATLAVALAAAVLPARSASRLAPAVALREE